MPTYEYECQKCGHEFQREQRITEDPIKTCPECGARKAKRLISRTSFVLKGGGWYKDLYSSTGSSSSSSDSGDSDSSSSSSKKSEKSEKKSSKKKGSGGKGSAAA